MHAKCVFNVRLRLYLLEWRTIMVGGGGINTLYIDLFLMFCFVLFLIIYSMFVISLKPFIFVLLYLVCIEHVNKNNL